MDPRDIPWEVVEKYSTRGPRYTSYPTAPHFTTDYDRGALEALWRGSGSPDLSVYVHVPYCKRRCLYCGCHTEVLHDGRDDPRPGYVEALLQEAAVAAGLLGPRRIRQLALGGGTPSILAPDTMDRLLAGLLGHWPADHGAELSAEVDPRTARHDLLQVMLDHGFNRFSLGVQDLDPDVQAIVGRVQPREQVQDLASWLSQRADSVNFDLIHGLPGQTAASWRRTIDGVVEMGPDRIAVFGYAHVPWMRPHQEALEGHAVPEARERVEMLGIAWERFLAAGYVAIGFDHFARPDDELAVALQAGSLHRNFMGYTTRRGLDQLGLGVSAISAVGASYAQDAKDHAPWRADLDAGRMPWERALILDEDDLLRREVILDLSCNLRIDFERFEQTHGVPFAHRFGPELRQLRPLAEDGLLELGDDGIRVTPRGRFLVRVACMAFDGYLGDKGDRPVQYSTTV